MSSGSIGSLFIDIYGRDHQFQTVAGKVQGVMGRLAGGLAGIGNSIMAGVGLAIGNNLGEALGRFARDSVVAGAEFEASMSKVMAVTNATAEQMGEMEQQAVQLGASTVFTASDVSAAMYELGSAGLSVQQIMSAMPGVLNLAAAGGLAMADAAAISAAALNNMDLAASEMPHVADVFAQAANTSAATVASLGESMKFAGPIGHTFGKSIEEVVGPLELLANAGIKGEMAGTGLRQVFSKLSGENKNVNKLFAQLGINIDAIKMLPLADQVDLINAKMAGMDSVEKAGVLLKTFGERGGPTMAILLEKGGEALRKFEGQLAESTGTAARVAATNLDNVKGSWEQLSGAIETVKINIFNSQKGMIRDAIDWATSMVSIIGRDGFLVQLGADIADTISIWEINAKMALLEMGISLADVFGNIWIDLGDALVEWGIRLSSLAATAATNIASAFKGVWMDLGDDMAIKYVRLKGWLTGTPKEEIDRQVAYIENMHNKDVDAAQKAKDEKLKAARDEKDQKLRDLKTIHDADAAALKATNTDRMTATESAWQQQIDDIENKRQVRWDSYFKNLATEDAKPKVDQALEQFFSFEDAYDKTVANVDRALEEFYGPIEGMKGAMGDGDENFKSSFVGLTDEWSRIQQAAASGSIETQQLEEQKRIAAAAEKNAEASVKILGWQEKIANTPRLAIFN